MATTPLADEPDALSTGAKMNEALGYQRQFLENVYALMRFIETEVTKRDWEMVKYFGYAVSRNGTGLGLTNFATADWIVNCVGLVFVPSGVSKSQPGASNTDTPIPPTGLELLYFQVRWLDKAPMGPTVWFGRLKVVPSNDKEARKWEEYQSHAMRRLEPRPSDNASRGSIAPFRLAAKGSAVIVEGDYVTVPILELGSEQDVMSRLVLPALREDS